jgi:hypothetical protein
VKIDYDGEVYDLDLEAITLKQAMVIQSYTGMSVMKLFERVAADEDSPEQMKAIAALYWLMMNQAGRQFPIAETDFPLLKFLQALLAGMVTEAPAQADAEAEPGPTGPSPAPSASPPVLLSPAPSPSPGGREVTPADTTAS